MQFIDAFNPAFRTMGRIGESKNHLPLWVFPYTQARFRFTGTSCVFAISGTTATRASV